MSEKRRQSSVVADVATVIREPKRNLCSRRTVLTCELRDEMIRLDVEVSDGDDE